MTRIVLTSLMSLSLVTLLGTGARADHRDPHDVLYAHAVDLANLSHELYDEIRLHYMGQPGTAHLLGDSLNVHRSARRLMSYSAAHSSLGTLEREMNRMESAFHHLEDTMRGVRHHHGSHRHVRELMRQMDDLVHHIHDDVHQMHDRRYIAPSPVVRPGDWYFGGGGFTIRLGR